MTWGEHGVSVDGTTDKLGLFDPVLHGPGALVRDLGDNSYGAAMFVGVDRCEAQFVVCGCDVVGSFDESIQGFFGGLVFASRCHVHSVLPPRESW